MILIIDNMTSIGRKKEWSKESIRGTVRISFEKGERR
jgi:hypothetical protein